MNIKWNISQANSLAQVSAKLSNRVHSSHFSTFSNSLIYSRTYRTVISQVSNCLKPNFGKWESGRCMTTEKIFTGLDELLQSKDQRGNSKVRVIDSNGGMPAVKKELVDLLKAGIRKADQDLENNPHIGFADEWLENSNKFHIDESDPDGKVVMTRNFKNLKVIVEFDKLNPPDEESDETETNAEETDSSSGSMDEEPPASTENKAEEPRFEIETEMNALDERLPAEAKQERQVLSVFLKYQNDGVPMGRVILDCTVESDNRLYINKIFSTTGMNELEQDKNEKKSRL